MRSSIYRSMSCHMKTMKLLFCYIHINMFNVLLSSLVNDSLYIYKQFTSCWSFSLFQALVAKNPSITQATDGKWFLVCFLFPILDNNLYHVLFYNNYRKGFFLDFFSSPYLLARLVITLSKLVFVLSKTTLL